MYHRHDLVWLSQAGWSDAGARAEPRHRAALLRWQQARWPLIVRRADADAGPDQVSLGVALPPDDKGDKLRIALRADAADIVRSSAPLPIRAVLPALPQAWRLALLALAEESVGLTFRVYGSVAMQALTGLAYLGPDSDIDLLFYPLTEQQLRAGLALLSRHAAALPLDGEIVFPRAEAVAWKEWLAAEASGAKVLVKEQGAVRLAPINLLLASLRPT
ncbi:MAG: malonate decarboxylase holo-[acyl-carrier-protein] synthase [Pseudomonadota bacterium]